MTRQASNPLPQFLTSPVLGDMFAAGVDEYADEYAKRSADQGWSPRDSVYVAVFRTAADEIRTYVQGVRQG